MAEMAERKRGIMSLKAPIGRVTSPDSVFAFGLAENDWLPNVEDIINKVKETVNFD